MPRPIILYIPTSLQHADEDSNCASFFGGCVLLDICHYRYCSRAAKATQSMKLAFNDEFYAQLGRKRKRNKKQLHVVLAADGERD